MLEYASEREFRGGQREIRGVIHTKYVGNSREIRSIISYGYCGIWQGIRRLNKGRVGVIFVRYAERLYERGVIVGINGF